MSSFLMNAPPIIIIKALWMQARTFECSSTEDPSLTSLSAPLLCSLRTHTAVLQSTAVGPTDLTPSGITSESSPAPPE